MQPSPEIRAISEAVAAVQERHSQGELSICAAHASGPKVPGPGATMTIWFLMASDELLRGDVAGELKSQLRAAVHRELSDRGFPDVASHLVVRLSSLASHHIGACMTRPSSEEAGFVAAARRQCHHVMRNGPPQRTVTKGWACHEGRY